MLGDVRGPGVVQTGHPGLLCRCRRHIPRGVPQKVSILLVLLFGYSSLMIYSVSIFLSI